MYIFLNVFVTPWKHLDQNKHSAEFEKQSFVRLDNGADRKPEISKGNGGTKATGLFTVREL